MAASELPPNVEPASPRLALIVAMDRYGLIGSRNRLPWNIPEDLAWFRGQTLGHTVIMGKNTWLSLGGVLDQRTNVILTRDTQFSVPGAIVCHSVAECLEQCGSGECFVIGGAQVFQSFLPLAGKLCLTRIDAEFTGDAYFPFLDLEHWELVFFETTTAQAGYKLTFSQYLRK